MVGATNATPFEEDEYDARAHDGASIEVDSAAARFTKSIRRLQDAAEACLEAVKLPAVLRKEKQNQIVFGELRGNHFLDQLSTAWQYEIAKTVEYKFVECGLEVYYNNDLLDEFYVILRGSVRLILEPTNTVYCRTIDISDKDTFAEQSVTNPGTRMVIVL